MAKVQNTFNGGTNGTTITEANSGGASGTAFDFIEILTGATATYSNSSPHQGAMCLDITGNGAHAFLEHDFVAPGKLLSMSFYLRIPSAPTAEVQLYTPRNSVNYIGGVNIRTDMKLRVTVNGGAGVFNTATVLATNTWYRVDISHKVATATTGEIQFKLFLGDSTTALDTYTSTTADLGTTDIIMYRLGKIGSSGNTPMRLDSITFEQGTTTLIGPFVLLNTPPIANAGTGGSDIEPGTTINLTGSGSSDPGGSIVSYVWTQLTGAAVTIVGSGANRVVVAPYTVPGTVLGFRLTVTDNLGATASADVSYTVLRCTERMAVGGQWVPAILKGLSLP